MELSEKQKQLLETFEPIDELKSELVAHPLLAYPIIDMLSGKKIPIEQKSDLLKTILSNTGIKFNIVMGAHSIIQILHEDRRIGLDLVLQAIKSRDSNDMDFHYLKESIGPLNYDEIRAIFLAFKDSGRRAFEVEAEYFLTRACSGNFSPLIRCIGEWIKDTAYFDMALRFAREVSKYFYRSSRDITLEAEELASLLIADLRSRGTTPAKTESNFPNASAYIQYLTYLYYMGEYDKTRIKDGLANHSVLSTFLPDTASDINKGNVEHPLAGVLNYEKTASEASSRIRELMQAEAVAERTSHSLIELWELEENIRNLLDSDPKGKIRDNLQNPEQFDDTKSELIVFRFLRLVGKVTIYPSDGLDGEITIDDNLVGFDVLHPRSDPVLEWGLGGGIHPHSKAERLKEKIVKFQNAKAKTPMPFVVFLDRSHSNVDKYNVENFVFGTLTFRDTINTKTGTVVKTEVFNDANNSGLSDDERCLLSAIIIFKRQLTPTGVFYTAEVVLNEKASCPISKELVEVILQQFNRHIQCGPILSTLYSPV